MPGIVSWSRTSSRIWETSVADQIVSARYAEALIGAIEDPGQLDEVNEEILAIDAIMRGNARFTAFVAGPNVPLEDKHGLVDKVFAGGLSQLTLDYLHLLLNKHRFDHFGGIAKEFTRLVEARRNQIRVKVTIAVDLGADVMDRLKRALDSSLGKDCILETTVDSRVIGGVVAVVENQVIDGSLRTALDELGKDLIATPLNQRTV
jgi:F-type H+-transporting ATPase subunit delta